ncbi:hypothetical protein H6P81_011940 [Aristolochia fimbriata]|uniref:Glycosyltransferase subfamily 4-like N-terminal domain-containing protein n=1 Tax=Aristolochia fimbriata TaxID=158543 RepID=A0AAV7EE54_ARIFI|nr:hypothetical protein H6P81_011940 [Aristolochia fimbriata]
MGGNGSTAPTKRSSCRSSSFYLFALLITSLFFFFAYPSHRPFENPAGSEQPVLFSGDLRDATIPWNKLCFGSSTLEKLKLAVFSKKWPVQGAAPGGMERHAFTLYSALAAMGHEVHVYTAPSDNRRPHPDVVRGTLHVHFVPNDSGSLNLSLAVQSSRRDARDKPFDYVHTESVSLPPWRARTMTAPDVAVTWHGIWYESMHSTLLEDLLWEPRGPSGSDPFLREAMPRLVDEIRFFPSYANHICISDSAGDALVNVYGIPPRNVHVILNGVDHTRFVHDPAAGIRFRNKHGVPSNDNATTLVMGVAGRLVRDKGHPLLYEAFSTIAARHPSVLLLVAGDGPWAKRYEELRPRVRVLGPLGPAELSDFYNAVDVFVNPTVRPQGLDLTLIEAMHCGKPLVTTNFPSIKGTVVVNGGLGYLHSPNVRSLVEAMEAAVRDGREALRRKGEACRAHARSMFTATKMAASYERFFLCMKNKKYCWYPLPTDC